MDMKPLWSVRKANIVVWEAVARKRGREQSRARGVRIADRKRWHMLAQEVGGYCRVGGRGTEWR